MILPLATKMNSGLRGHFKHCCEIMGITSVGVWAFDQMGYCLLSTVTHGPRETDICQELPSCSYQDYVHCVMAILLVVQMAVRCLVSVIIV